MVASETVVRVEPRALGEEPSALAMTFEAARQPCDERVLGAHLEDRTVERIRRIVDELPERSKTGDEPAEGASWQKNRNHLGLRAHRGT